MGIMAPWSYSLAMCTEGRVASAGQTLSTPAQTSGGVRSEQGQP